MNPIDRFLGIFSHDIGIDLGTANTLVYVRGKGVVIREPSAVARHKKTKEILAIGTSAKKMMGRAPVAIEVIRPLRNGVIADFDATAAMLSHYIKKVHETESTFPKIPRPRVVIGIPSGVTEVERRAVAEAAIDAGAREANLIEEPMAAAIGAGLLIEGPEGNFIVDIGGGTSEIAVISLGGIVLGRSVRIAGDEMDEAIINYVRLKYSLLLGQPTAEAVKIGVGGVEMGEEALSPILQEIISNIVDTIEETQPELTGDIMKKGITLAGGGSLIPGIDKAISEAAKMPVYIADDPLTCVVRGCGLCLEDNGLLKRIRVTKGL